MQEGFVLIRPSSDFDETQCTEANSWEHAWRRAHLNMTADPGYDTGIGIELAQACHVGSHSQQVGVIAVQLRYAGPSAAVVLQ